MWITQPPKIVVNLLENLQNFTRMERLSLEQLFHRKMSLSAPDVSADRG